VLTTPLQLVRRLRALGPALASAVAVALVASLPGCTYIMGDPSPRFVGTETLERIDKGSTTQDWVVAVFGQPVFKARLVDGETQIWKYPYEFADKDGSRMKLLSEREGERASRVVFVQLSGGVVTDWWRD
jgi:outer membrane protein assembly factor BamE (lipoprotein component of BamABCDE complex)